MTKPKNPYKRPDRFTKEAKEAGYKARSVFKLEEVQRRFRVFRQAQLIVDLGCFPGSWSQYALQQTGRHGRVVGVDLKAPVLPNGVFLARSVYDVSPEELVEALGGPADVVLSDMAPNTTGVAYADHVQQVELVRRALELACAVLAPGGVFLTKVFDGEEVPALQAELRNRFGKLRRVRPEAVRQNSREFYILATEFKG
jgi:23S rRNA (uridine2552-2'-O)-methyltransferase